MRINTNQVELHPTATPLPMPNRRQACTTLAAGALAAVSLQTSAADTVRAGLGGNAQASLLSLPALPYATNALDPVISSATLETHWGKHHRAYIDNLYKLVAGTPMDGASLVDLIRRNAQGANRNPLIFNNAAQTWNHQFYWESMRPKGGGRPPAAVLQAVQDSAWGSFDALREAMIKQATGIFGSGWLWLAVAPGTRRIVLQETFNADTLAKSDALVPLAVIDVWEHAYYIDYRNRRKDHVEAVVDKVLDWGRVESRLAAAAHLPKAAPSTATSTPEPR